jgi:2-oxoglutarate ferredoxin oxidoreductase subunit gamma
MPKRTSEQVLLCGLGGQGVVLAGSLLGAAGFSDGLKVSGTASYGAAARGGECRSEVVLSSADVAFPFVTRADILIALSQSAYNKYLAWTATSGVVYYDPDLVEPEEDATQRHVAIPASKKTEEALGTKTGANITMLAAVVAASGATSFESLVEVVKTRSPKRFLNQNIKALELGRALGEEVV